MLFASSDGSDHESDSVSNSGTFECQDVKFRDFFTLRLLVDSFLMACEIDEQTAYFTVTLCSFLPLCHFFLFSFFFLHRSKRCSILFVFLILTDIRLLEAYVRVSEKEQESMLSKVRITPTKKSYSPATYERKSTVKLIRGSTRFVTCAKKFRKVQVEGAGGGW